MEAVLLQYCSPDQPISPFKSPIRTPKKGINRSFISRPSENFAPLSSQAGIIQAPPPFLFHSYPPVSVQRLPPLLPLPISKPHNTNTPPRVRGLSCPPTNRKANNNTRTRDSSFTPRKSKPVAISPKKEENLKPENTAVKVLPPSEVVLISSAKPLGPDPKDLPKNVSKILTLSLSGSSNTINNTSNTFSSLKAATKDQVDEFSGSVAFTTISPPPSSLPLPTFSLRPKLSCNVEAVGIDAGATDNLRRLLRLR